MNDHDPTLRSALPPSQAAPVVTLTTDFGLDDGYVPVLHGVILNIAPQARIIDYSHAVPPQRIATAAYLLGNGYRFFPPGTIHVVVVDPGVGTPRRAAAVATPSAMFVGPDNGLLDALTQPARAAGEPVTAVALTEPRWWLPKVSSTFHGRDIFAPIAAHLANGVPLSALGSPISELHPMPSSEPLRSDTKIQGEVIHIDHFGNCITNLQASDCIAMGAEAQVVIRSHRLQLVPTYGGVAPGAACALIGSSGRLEIAVRDGNAARNFSITLGDSVAIRSGAAAKRR